jgi:hypothetical protein
MAVVEESAETLRKQPRYQKLKQVKLTLYDPQQQKDVVMLDKKI